MGVVNEYGQNLVISYRVSNDYEFVLPLLELNHCLAHFTGGKVLKYFHELIMLPTLQVAAFLFFNFQFLSECGQLLDHFLGLYRVKECLIKELV